MIDRLLDRMMRREPDFIIGRSDDPYLRRWWLIPRNRFFNIYLHEFLRSDDDRALHDHPWLNLSILLRGSYREWTPYRDGLIFRTFVAGDFKFRRATAAHRIEVDYPCVSLFVTGPRVREWGFHCPQGWVHWKLFTAPGNYGEIGRGCDQ